MKRQPPALDDLNGVLIDHLHPITKNILHKDTVYSTFITHVILF